MSALEREIFEKFQQLQPVAQRRVMALMVQAVASEPETADASAFDDTLWWKQVAALQDGIRARLGEQATVGALALLDELREEES